MSFKDKDHFSGHADCYEAFRPTYPTSLFEYLGSLCSSHDVVWDCATGNGQAARPLADCFRAVIATGASQKQIDQAHSRANIRYFVAPAEKVPIEDGSVDLVTVAQALHWLDLRGFYAEVKRVVRPPGVIAVWCYQLHTVAPEIDSIIDRLYTDIVGADWPPERRLVEDGYRTLAFPFEEITPPPFQMVHSWRLNHLLGYLCSWSSVQRYRARTQLDALELIRADLEAAWGDPDGARDVTWPLLVRVGLVSKSS
jgi:ubiquinone/menaquinone biosynthesis C-methylase UbiE